MNLLAVALLFLQAGVLLAALTVCGYPIARFVRHITHSRRITGLVALPLLGLYPLIQMGWLWSVLFDTGVAVAFPVTVAVFSVVTLMLWLTEGYHGSPSDRVQAFRNSRSVRAVLGIFVALAAVHLVINSGYLDLSYVTPAPFKNYDLPHFALLSEHLRHGGFTDPGALSRYFYDDVDGVFFVNLLPATLLGQSAWTTVASTLFVGWFLLGWQLWLLVRRVGRVRPAIAGISTVIALASPLSFYVAGHGFISHFFGSALVMAGCAVLCVVRNRRKEMLSASLVLGLIFATLWHIYPFAALAVPVLGLAFRFLSQRVGVSIRQVRFLSLVTALGVLISAVLANGRFPQAMRQVIAESIAEAGWTATFSPRELLTATSGLNFTPSLRWFGILAVVLAVAAAGFLLRHVPATARLGAMLVVAFGSYVLIYSAPGITYQQWKWASLMAPLAAATFVAFVATATSAALRRSGLRMAGLLGAIIGSLLFAGPGINAKATADASDPSAPASSGAVGDVSTPR